MGLGKNTLKMLGSWGCGSSGRVPA
jgi:hypothetical protein